MASSIQKRAEKLEQEQLLQRVQKIVNDISPNQRPLISKETVCSFFTEYLKQVEKHSKQVHELLFGGKEYLGYIYLFRDLLARIHSTLTTVPTPTAPVAKTPNPPIVVLYYPLLIQKQSPKKKRTKRLFEQKQRKNQKRKERERNRQKTPNKRTNKGDSLVALFSSTPKRIAGHKVTSTSSSLSLSTPTSSSSSFCLSPPSTTSNLMSSSMHSYSSCPSLPSTTMSSSIHSSSSFSSPPSTTSNLMSSSTHSSSSCSSPPSATSNFVSSSSSTCSSQNFTTPKFYVQKDEKMIQQQQQQVICFQKDENKSSFHFSVSETRKFMIKESVGLRVN